MTLNTPQAAVPPEKDSKLLLLGVGIPLVAILVLVFVAVTGSDEMLQGGLIFLISPLLLVFFGFATALFRSPYPDPELEEIAGPGAKNLPAESLPGIGSVFMLFCWVTLWYAAVLGVLAAVSSGIGVILGSFIIIWAIHLLLVQSTSRQEELARVMVTAAKNQASLAEAIRALAADAEPKGTRKWIHAFGRFLLLPGWSSVQGSTWRWPARLRRLARRLECGQSLGEALSIDPKLVPSAYRVSSQAALGEIALVGFLDRTPPLSSGLLWLEIFPRLAYPLFLIVIVGILLTFHALYIAPKMQRIFREFNIEAHGLGAWALEGGKWIQIYGLVTFAVQLFLGWIALMIALGPSYRWWLPFARILYRPEVKGGVIRRMGLILERGHTEVEALGALEASPGLPYGMRKKLREMLADLRAGGSLLVSLGHRLRLKRGEMALLEAASRARQLPWVMVEIGEKKIRNTIRRIGWFSQVILIGCVIGLGVLVGMVAFSWFAPLVQLIEVLAE